MAPKRTIGLTGGIGTGKSTVARHLAQAHGLPVLDADAYAREAVRPGSPILDAILARYGRHLQHPDGSLDRAALGELAFGDARERRWLERQIHPYVRERFQAALAQLQAPKVVLAVPLLFEAGMHDLATEIWVVHCNGEQQLARLQARDGLSQQQLRDRIASQWPLGAKMAAADVVLDNTASRERLLQQADEAVRSPPINRRPL